MTEVKANSAQAPLIADDLFFAIPENGGTNFAPAYASALEVLNMGSSEHPSDRWNRYILTVTDGDSETIGSIPSITNGEPKGS